MNKIKRYDQFMNESTIPFSGSTVADLAKALAQDSEALICAGDMTYMATDDIGDPSNTVAVLFDEDGNEHNVEISSIEYLETRG